MNCINMCDNLVACSILCSPNNNRAPFLQDNQYEFPGEKLFIVNVCAIHPFEDYLKMH